MNPLLRKEIRLVLPAWGLAMVLAAVPAWLFWPAPYGLMAPAPGLLVFVSFAIGALLLGIAPFGQELSSGMFSIFLAQPMPRNRVWLLKTAVLTMALGIALVTFCLSIHFRMESLLETMKSTAWRNAFSRQETPEQILNLISEARRTAWIQSALIGGLAVAAAIGGGLWTTLFFRQISAALWFALLVPTGLTLLTLKIFGNASNPVLALGMILVLGGYSIVGYGWARKLYLRAQDTQWTGGVIALPDWLSRSNSATAAQPSGRRRPIRTLIRNELQANHINFLLAAGLLVLHLSVLVLRRLSGDYLAEHRNLAMALESVPILWLAMPLMIGSIAVAEERKLGTMEALLCLPTARRTQFAIKLIITLFLGVFLGGIVPITLEALGQMLGLPANAGSMAFNFGILSFEQVPLLGAAGLSLCSFYSSTLTRNTLQAMGAGLTVGMVAFFTIEVLGGIGNAGGLHLWSRQLIGWIGWPVMIAAVLALAFANYKRLHNGSRNWLRNLMTLVLALVGVMAAATIVYHRAWEPWVPEEPAHRSFPSYFATVGDRPRPAFAARPKIAAASFRIAVVLPDGRLWMRQAPTQQAAFGSPKGRSPNLTLQTQRQTGPWRSEFLPGADWRDVAVTGNGCFALQSNGALWDLSNAIIDSKQVVRMPDRPMDSGSWKSLAASGDHIVGLKSDGTLWEWGQRWIRSNGIVTAISTAVPIQVGAATDWTVIGDCDELSAAMKADGSLWRWRSVSDFLPNGSWTNRLAEQPERWLAMPAKQTVTLSLWPRGVAAVLSDGAVWLGGGAPYGAVSPETAASALTNMVRWGQESSWREVAFTWWERFIAIKQDGVLCESDPSQMPWRTMAWTVRPVAIPSSYADWLTACGYGDGYLALAADGTLCYWQNQRNRRFVYYGPGNGALLPSRINAWKVASIPVPFPSR